MKFQNTAPNTYKLHLGRGSFIVQVENPVVASIISQSLVPNHSEILIDLLKTSKGLSNLSPNDQVVAVIESAKPDPQNSAYSKVTFNYYVT